MYLLQEKPKSLRVQYETTQNPDEDIRLSPPEALQRDGNFVRPSPKKTLRRHHVKLSSSEKHLDEL